MYPGHEATFIVFFYRSIYISMPSFGLHDKIECLQVRCFLLIKANSYTAGVYWAGVTNTWTSVFTL